MSSLGETINETKYYSQRNESGVEAEELVNWRTTFSDSWCEYFYLFNPGQDKWYYATKEDDRVITADIQLKDL